MYSVLSYGEMVTDRVRMDAYARAIERVVRAGDVVLDIGAGTGIMSLLAARAGAKRVHAVDPNPAVHLIPELAAENGFEGRIQIHPTSSLELELPEKVDVVVSDLRGSFPMNGHHVEVLRDARARLLKPEGVMLPARDRFFVAAVDSPEVERRLSYGVAGYERLGFTANVLRASIVNSVHSDSSSPLHASDLVTTAGEWAAVEYGAWRGGVAEGEVELVARRTGIVNALAIWFEATIHEELRYDNAPGQSLVYARFVLPLREAVELRVGDRVEVTVRVDERGTRWAWDFGAVDGGSGSAKALFRQSSFLGTPTSAAALLRASTGFAPTLSPRGSRLAKILGAMDGQRPISAIVDALSAGDGPRSRCLDEVNEAVERYAR